MQDFAVLIKSVKKDGRMMKKMVCPTGKHVKAGLYYYEIRNKMSGFSALKYVLPTPVCNVFFYKKREIERKDYVLCKTCMIAFT